MIKAALFDLDGVVLDTEKQYSQIWGEIGQRFHPEIPNFEMVIKGQTLTQIFANHFANVELQKQVEDYLNHCEANMQYNFILGADKFILSLRQQGIKTALVTSSNNTKMRNVYNAHPNFLQLWDTIVTADMIQHSKPDPECFLLAAHKLNANADECLVFEDSIHGLQAGRAAQMKVIGLATTYPRNVITDKADIVIDNFSEQQTQQILLDIQTIK